MHRTKVALIFDDGFLRSTLATAELFETYRLSAVFAVLAHPSGFTPEIQIGDFTLWNALRARGHTIHPHGYTHANLAAMDYAGAIAEIERALAAFNTKMRGFDPATAVWCYAYNAGTPALNQWLLQHVGAVRPGGSGLLSSAELASRVWHGHAYGPDDPGTDLMDHLARARRDRPAALVYCLHGLDGEGWGAIAKDRLRRALDVLVSDESLEYWAISAQRSDADKPHE